MKCALCLREDKLCNSHIIPEFLYTSLYDDKHRFHAIALNAEQRDKLLQKGVREKLLCASCEQAFSESESYASKLLNGGMQITGYRRENWLHLTGLNYRLLKLFQLSVLWRAGVSSLPEFSQVQLGLHQEEIRLMLLSGDPGPQGMYGCIMCVVTRDSEPLRGLIVPPFFSRLDGHDAYCFVFGGVAFVYVVPNSQLPGWLIATFAQQAGDAVVRLTPVTEMGYLMDGFAKLQALGKISADV